MPSFAYYVIILPFYSLFVTKKGEFCSDFTFLFFYVLRLFGMLPLGWYLSIFSKY